MSGRSGEQGRARRKGWDFGYAPIPAALAGDEPRPCDVIVATSASLPPSATVAALRGALDGPEVEILCDEAPIFWQRVRSPAVVRRADLEARLREHGLPLRYVASAVAGDLSFVPLDTRGAPRARPHAWRARGRSSAPEPDTRGRWFVRDGEGGLAVDRARFGTGAGTRLAVIDDDAASAERLSLDAEILIHVERPPRSQHHGALMVAWAVGSAPDPSTGVPGFRGVAPDASPRLYDIPKAGRDVISLPLAIVRAVRDGADVILCATYVDGAASPMLDDALEVALRLGRGGRGTPIVIPTGREASSPPGSVHASWSLALGDPAADPRVLCIGPSGYGGGWFLWRDSKKRLRPFANRGPSVRWLAPGDDLAYPFAEPERLFHAESSGSSCVAAGALLLVLEANPSLRVGELVAVVTTTARRLDPLHPDDLRPLADRCDVLPEGADRDGHNAKHGYGRIDAGRACLAAADPVAAALIAMGEDGAARAFWDARVRDPSLRAAYSPRLARWAARAVLADPSAAHALRVVLRHLRLLVGHEDRQRAQPTGALARQIALIVHDLTASRRRRPAAVAAELDALSRRAAAFTCAEAAAGLETAVLSIAARVFSDEEPITESCDLDSAADITRFGGASIRA